MIENNKLIAEFMGAWSHEYKVSTIKDINGVLIKEGDIINADGYNSEIDSVPVYIKAVEYDEDRGLFGSCVYGDFDLLHTYKTVEVIGHVEQFRHLYNNGKKDQWSGNLGACLKEFSGIAYDKDWRLLMPVVQKIRSLNYYVTLSGVSSINYNVLMKREIVKSQGKENWEDIEPISEEVNGLEIASVYKLVLKFIQWYNTQKQSV